jgi:hypothetical protein
MATAKNAAKKAAVVDSRAGGGGTVDIELATNYK